MAEWSLDSLLDGDLLTISGAAVIGVGLVSALFASLKGRRIGPWFSLIASVLAVLLLLSPLSLLEEVAPGIAQWVETNSEDLITGVALAVLIGLLGTAIGWSRLAKPSSWWAQRRYQGDKYQEALDRYGWTRIRSR